MVNMLTKTLPPKIVISNCRYIADVSSGVMVNKLDEQTFKSEFEFHWVPHSYGLVSHLSKKLSKLQQHLEKGASGGGRFNYLDEQTFTSEFESRSMPYLYAFLPHISKKLSKLQQYWQKKRLGWFNG